MNMPVSDQVEEHDQSESSLSPKLNTADMAAAAAEQLRRLSGVDRFDVALTVGSGWKTAVADLGETIAEIPASDVPGFIPSTVVGHAGTLRSVRMANGSTVLVIGARTHYYEGYSVDAVVHGVRTAAALGVRIMVLTNGAGGLRKTWVPGQAVLISDHINLTARSPIVGANFVDLTDLYSRRLRDIARSVDATLDEGVYAQLPGPDYETPAEVHMIGILGGEIVGMSTALEAIAAREAGLEVFGISLITNLAAGIQDGPLNHGEVLRAGLESEGMLGPLLAKIVTKFSNNPAQPVALTRNTD